MTKILFAIHCVFSGFLAGDLASTENYFAAVSVLVLSIIFFIYYLIMKWAGRRINQEIDILESHMSDLENILLKKKNEHN